METRLLHVRINVGNLQAAIGWYQETLGFELATVWPREDPIYADFEVAEGAIFAVVQDERVPTHGRVNFYEKDVDELWSRLQDKVEVVEPLFDTPYGQRKFTIRDPDGNEIGFIKG